MKKLLIALLMISGMANAQTITNQRQSSERQRWQLLGGLKVDSSFQLPWRDTSRYGSNGFFSDLYINKSDSLLKFRDPRTGLSTTLTPSSATTPNLQDVTTGAGNNISSHSLAVNGMDGLNTAIQSTVLYDYAVFVDGGGIGHTSGGNFRRMLEYSEAAGQTILYNDAHTQTILLREQTPSNAGIVASGRIQGIAGINSSDLVTVQQLQDSTGLYAGSGIRIENDTVKLGINMDDAGVPGRLTTPTELGMYGGSGEGRIQISDVAIGLSTQSGSDGSFMNVQRGVSTSTASVRKQYAGNAQELIFNADNDIILMDNIKNSGLKYSGKYRDELTDRSIMDKEYIDSMGAAITSGAGTVTNVAGTTNRITSTGGATPVIDIASTYVGQGSITTVGALSSGSLGTGFTGVTPATSDSTTKVSTTAYVKQVVGTAVNADSLAKFVRQGGDTRGTQLVIGTRDGFTVDFKVNNSIVSRFNSSGLLLGGGVANLASGNNASVTTLSTGTTISSNKANSDNVATINNIHASSTGLNIVSQNAGTNTFSVSKGGNVIANGQLNIGTLATFGSNSIVPTHSITIPSVGTGWRHYNTVDQVTNTESVTGAWTANKYNIAVAATGTGVARSMGLNAGVANLTIGGTGLSGIMNLAASASTTNTSFFGLTGTHSATSGLQNAFSILPSYTQLTTAGYRCFWISALETTLGSGIHFLIDAGTNTSPAGGGTHTSKFTVDNAGNVVGLGFTGSNFTSNVASTNGLLTMGTGGVATTVSRNLNDAIAAFNVNQIHASSSGDILTLQSSNVTNFAVAKNGSVTSTGVNFTGTYSSSVGISGGTSSLRINNGGVGVNTSGSVSYMRNDSATSDNTTQMSKYGGHMAVDENVRFSDTTILVTRTNGTGTVTLATIPMPASKTYSVEVRVVSWSTDTGDEAATWHNAVGVRRSGSGTPIILGAGMQTMHTSIKSSLYLLADVTASISGNNLIISTVSGDAELAEWKAYISIVSL